MSKAQSKWEFFELAEAIAGFSFVAIFFASFIFGFIFEAIGNELGAGLCFLTWSILNPGLVLFVMGLIALEERFKIVRRLLLRRQVSSEHWFEDRQDLFRGAIWMAGLGLAFLALGSFIIYVNVIAR